MSMPCQQGCIRTTAGGWLLALALIAAFAGSARAGVVYDSGGFEAPTFSLGALTGQDSGLWVESGSGATAVVQNTTAASGTQAVQVQRTSGDDRFFPQLPTTPTNNKLAHKANGFVDPSATGFSDADISALAAQSEPPTEPGVAIFDNYKVATSAAPPVNMVALPPAFWSGVTGLVFAACLAIRYRRGRAA